MNGKKKKNNNMRKYSNKNAKSLSFRPIRSRRLVSVSTSFSSTPQEFEDTLRQMKSKNHAKSKKLTATEKILKQEVDEEEDEFTMTVPIKEVDSESDNQEEVEDQSPKIMLKRNLSDIPQDRERSSELLS